MGLRKRDEAAEEWRRLHNNELYALYSSQSTVRLIKSRKTRWGGHVTRIGETKGAYMVLLRKLDGRRPLVKSWRGWEDNIKMDL